MTNHESAARESLGVHTNMHEPDAPRQGDYVIREFFLRPVAEEEEDGIHLFFARAVSGGSFGYHESEVEALAAIWADARPRGKDNSFKLRVWREDLEGETTGRLDPHFVARWESQEVMSRYLKEGM